MQRLLDWEARLAAYLAPLRAQSFAWGEHDCCTFVAGAVMAITGVDPMPEYRGRYRTRVGSLRALRRLGAGTVEAAFDAKFSRISPAIAQRGDLVMSGGVMGLCLGPFLVAIGSEGDREGLVRFDRATWDDPIAWAVGRELS